MAIEFYDVKERKKVNIEETDITKTKYERKLKDGSEQTRYAFRAKYKDRQLTKFCSKADWDKIKQIIDLTLKPTKNPSLEGFFVVPELGGFKTEFD